MADARQGRHHQARGHTFLVETVEPKEVNAAQVQSSEITVLFVYDYSLHYCKKYNSKNGFFAKLLKRC